MSEEKLRHGQALAIQWVTFLLQKVVEDIDNGGEKTRELIGNAQSVGKFNDLKTIALGYHYVLGSALPLAIELALKALLLKEGVTPRRTHDLLSLYSGLPELTRTMLQDKFQTLDEIDGYSERMSLILENHRTDFPDWRYLDSAGKLFKEENKKLQIAICTLLEIYNSSDA